MHGAWCMQAWQYGKSWWAELACVDHGFVHATALAFYFGITIPCNTIDDLIGSGWGTDTIS